MPKFIIVLIVLILISPAVFAGSSTASSTDLSSTAPMIIGQISVKSAHNVSKTLDKLEAILKKKGMTIFSRINHAKAAKGVGITLRPTELLIFGNPKIGSTFMKCKQTIAIDLPQKALAWEDDKGQVWLSYNDPSYIASRHGIALKDSACEKVINKVTNALGNFSKAATKP